jgi:uncharacterized protein YlxW (UPF0749 family)
MGMKRTALAIVLITVSVLSIVTWFVHSQISELQAQNSELHDQNRDLQDKNDELQEQLNELQKQIDDARNVMITEFSSLHGWWNLVGVTMAVELDITILNTGINDVEGLTLEIKRSNFDEDPFNRTRTLGILHAGETIEIQESIVVNMDRYFDEFYNSVF